MANRIRHFEFLDVSYETGYGVPTHIQLKGSLFVDVNEPNLYQNQDGLADWTLVSSGGSGGTSDSFSVFSASTGSVSATGPEQTLNYSGINVNIITNDVTKTITFSASTGGGGGGSPTANTYVNSFTYNNANTLTIGRNDATTFDVNLDFFTGITVNGDFTVTGDTILNGVTANTITGTFFGDGSNLTGVSTEDNYVSSGVYNTGTTSIDFSGTNSATTFSVDVSLLVNLPIVDIDKVTGNISLIGYGIDSACKIQRINTTGGGYSSTWANGDDITLDKVWSLRGTYTYF